MGIVRILALFKLKIKSQGLKEGRSRAANSGSLMVVTVIIIHNLPLINMADIQVPNPYDL